MISSRRTFLRNTQSFALGLLGLKALCLSGKSGQPHPGYGVLIKDPAKILDLPNGFTYKIIGRTGDQMSDGFFLLENLTEWRHFHLPKEMRLLLSGIMKSTLKHQQKKSFWCEKQKLRYFRKFNFDKGKSKPCLGEPQP